MVFQSVCLLVNLWAEYVMEIGKQPCDWECG